MIGKTMSMRSAGRPDASRRWRTVGSGTRCRRAAPDGGFFPGPAMIDRSTDQRPFLSMRTGTTSYFRGSSAAATDAAEWTETSCSPERPPNSRMSESLRGIRSGDEDARDERIDAGDDLVVDGADGGRDVFRGDDVAPLPADDGPFVLDLHAGDVGD